MGHFIPEHLTLVLIQYVKRDEEKREKEDWKQELHTHTQLANFEEERVKDTEEDSEDG